MIINLKRERESINTVYVTDFGDEYHNDNIVVSSELESKARKIRRRYKDIIEFIHAKAVYDEYMDVVFSRYPSKKIAKDSIASGFSTGFIPPKPRMKANSQAYKLMKKGVILSSVNWNKTDLNDASSIMDSYRQDDYDQMEIHGEISDKKYKSLVSGARFKNNIDDDIKNLGSVNDFDLIQNFFERKAKAGGGGLETTTYDPRLVPINKLLDDDYYNAQIDTTDDDEIIFHNGRHMTRKEYKELEIYDRLASMGYDSIKIMKAKGGNISSGAKRIAKLTQKRNKRMKKKNKKRDKVLAQAGGVSIGSSFEDYENDMLDFTFK